MKGALLAVGLIAAITAFPGAATALIVGVSAIGSYSMLQEHFGWEIFPWEEESKSYFEMTPEEQSASLGSLTGWFTGGAAGGAFAGRFIAPRVANLRARSTTKGRGSTASAAKKPSIFARDKATGATKHIFPKKQSVSKSQTKALREKFLGEKVVKVGPGKWRNADGSRQFRLKPGDYAGSHGEPHVHLEFLKPNQAGTKFIVEKNVHIPLVD